MFGLLLRRAERMAQQLRVFLRHRPEEFAPIGLMIDEERAGPKASTGGAGSSSLNRPRQVAFPILDRVC